jgi:hypothetical protein
MERAGVVLIWIGTGSDRQAFNRMLEYSIGEDDRFDPGRFCKAAGVESYDSDIFGRRFYPKRIAWPPLLFNEAPDIASRVGPTYRRRTDTSRYEYDRPKALSVDGFGFTILGCLNVPPYDNEPRTLNVDPASAGNATMSLGSQVKGRSEPNRSLKPKRAT